MTSTQAINDAADLLKGARKAVALTGAGISTPSGIPDFRSAESGLWQKADPTEVASILGFTRKPQAFYDWVRPLVNTLREAQPNAAHMALATLEQTGYLHSVITQNIDMLHTRAGSREVYEVHGNMRTATCMQCAAEVDAAPHFDRVAENGEVPHCLDCGGVLKPGIILFGEMLPEDTVRAAEMATRTCDVMIVAGSSLEVMPVAGLPETALQNGAKIILVNFESTYIDARADVVIHDDVASVLPKIVEIMGIDQTSAFSENLS